MKEFTAKSGAKIVISCAPWAAAKALKMAIESEMGPEGLKDLASMVLKVDASPRVDAALWPCLIRCTREGEKITEKTFDSVEARRDYYDIISACVEENLRPLADSLFSKLCELGIVKKPNVPASV